VVAGRPRRRLVLAVAETEAESRSVEVDSPSRLNYSVFFVCANLAGVAGKTRKGAPFSVRFAAATDRAVAEEARRTRRSKGAVVETLAEEALRTRRFPGIAFRGDDARRRPWVIGTGLDVWEIAQMLDEFDSRERLVRDTQLTERHLRLVEAYRAAYPDEVDEAIADNRRSVEEWRERYPFIEFESARE
jgi:hypothetical protein